MGLEKIYPFHSKSHLVSNTVLGSRGGAHTSQTESASWENSWGSREEKTVTAIQVTESRACRGAHPRLCERGGQAEPRRASGEVECEWVMAGWSGLATKGNRGKESMVPVLGETTGALNV